MKITNFKKKRLNNKGLIWLFLVTILSNLRKKRKNCKKLKMPLFFFFLFIIIIESLFRSHVFMFVCNWKNSELEIIFPFFSRILNLKTSDL